MHSQVPCSVGMLLVALGAQLLLTLAPNWFINTANISYPSLVSSVDARFGLLTMCVSVAFKNASFPDTNACYRLHTAQSSLSLLSMSNGVISTETFSQASICSRFNMDANSTMKALTLVTGLGDHDLARYLTWECDSPHVLSVWAIIALVAGTVIVIIWSGMIMCSHYPYSKYFTIGKLWLIMALCYGWVFAEIITRIVWRALVVGDPNHLAYGTSFVFLLLAYLLQSSAMPKLALYQRRLTAHIVEGIYCV
ncbi:hypothetical protein THRCLA_01897 [Thraustotheca clavata]|uniref:Transmembrane protein n=1 Tax=Thraustotheca clavata TaxID=74557 RepID=A0A1W0A745_9STRA|nr:hypothetical protein THRCLA_01897 [Thraustotheca clavata]